MSATIIKWLVALVIIACVLKLCSTAHSGGESGPIDKMLGKPVPDFQLTTLDGQPIDQTIFQGHVTLLNDWASWCGVCEGEMGELQRLGQTYDIQVYGLNTQNDPNTELAALKSWGNPFIATIYDPDWKLAAPLRIPSAVPVTFIIDKQGIIRFEVVGGTNYGYSEQTLVPLIKKLQAENE